MNGFKWVPLGILSAAVMLFAVIAPLQSHAEENTLMRDVRIKSLVRTIPLDAGRTYISWVDEPRQDFYMKWRPAQNICIIGAWVYVEVDYRRQVDGGVEWTDGVGSIDAELSLTPRTGSDIAIARCITANWCVNGVYTGNHVNQTIVMFPAGYGVKVGPTMPDKYVFVNVAALNEATTTGYMFVTVKTFVYYILN